MRLLRLFFRFIHIVLACAGALLAYCVRRIRAGRVTAERRERIRGGVLADLLQRLGATFVKFGQILSTRPDLLGPGYVKELAALQDAVPPVPYSHVEAVLDEELAPPARARLVEIDPTPVASASVAQVHRGRLDTGEAVAVKLQRPLAASQIERDLAILGFGARMLDMVPSVRLLSLPGAVEHFGVALRGQLDFCAELEHNRRFAKNFADVEGVDVPAVYPELSTKRVLVMEFVEGVKATEPEKVGGDRAALARRGGEAILKMVFTDGFVHADLHPGNIILTHDDRVVLIDLGMVTEIPDDLKAPWVQTFVALSQQNGADAARLFYSYAPRVATRDYAAFEADVVGYLERLYGKTLGEVEISVVVSGMMNVLRRHHVQVDPTFTVVNIAMLVAEGLGKQLDPNIDLVPLAMPYLTSAMATAGGACRPPLREPPTRDRPQPEAA